MPEKMYANNIKLCLYLLKTSLRHYVLFYATAQQRFLQNPEEQPEFPIVTRKYFVRFLFLEDSSSNQHELLDMVQEQQHQMTAAQSQEQVRMTGLQSQEQVRVWRVSGTSACATCFETGVCSACCNSICTMYNLYVVYEN